MIERPNGYLTLEKRVRKRARLADQVLWPGSDALAWRLLLVALWLITILWGYNVGLHAR